MNLFLDLLIYGLLFLFVWVSSFLYHELMHIVGTGRLHGTITVDGLSMSATPANLWAGGILSGFVFTTAGVLIWVVATPALGYLFIVSGVVNLVYGVFETMFLPSWGNNQDYRLGRYSIYIGVTASMLFLWMVILR
jgi:hypothetical protein